jgi:hypothetical protein
MNRRTYEAAHRRLVIDEVELDRPASCSQHRLLQEETRPFSCQTPVNLIRLRDQLNRTLKERKDMKHRMTSPLLKLTTLVAAAALAVTPAAQAAPTPVAQTGVVPLGPNQALRLTVRTGTGADTLVVRFTTALYAGSPNGGIWKTTNISQTTFGPVTVLPSEAASIDITPTGGIAVQGLVFSSNPNVHVTGEIIDVATGEVQGIIAILIAL